MAVTWKIRENLKWKNSHITEPPSFPSALVFLQLYLFALIHVVNAKIHVNTGEKNTICFCICRRGWHCTETDKVVIIYFLGPRASIYYFGAIVPVISIGWIF